MRRLAPKPACRRLKDCHREPVSCHANVQEVVMRFATSSAFFHSHEACAAGDVLRSDVRFAGRRPRFSGTHLALFSPSLRRNCRRSQGRRFMFSRTNR